MKHNENILKKHMISAKTAVISFGEALLGIVFSHTEFGSIAPFGVAYSSVSSVFGAVGAILGYIINGQDIFRYCIATAVNCAARIFLWKIVPLPNEFKAFLFTMWAFLAAGISGIFVVENSFEANCLFIVGGIAGGVSAFILSVASESLEGKKRFTAAVRFVFICICVSAALSGIYGLGPLFRHTASIGAFFLLCCICGKFSIFISVTHASFTGLFLFITDTALFPVLCAITVGAILAGILRSFGKYPVILAFIASASLVTIVSNGKVGIFEILPDVVFAGILYAIAPSAVIKKITDAVSSGINNGVRKKPIKRKAKFALHKKASETLGYVCDGCKKKILCWVRDYSETADVFNRIKSAQKSGKEPTIPEHFKNKCEKYPEIVASLIKEEPYDTVLYADSASASTPKKGESICGDTCTSFISEDGKQVYVIADGMGTGANAGQQSFRISTLLKKLLAQGFDRNDALKIVNETLLKSSDETVMGIDIAILNEKTGLCEFVKAGAAPSFVLRSGEVYEIGASTLPIGILEDVSSGKSKCMLKDGDVIIMISDGYISNDGEWLKTILSSVNTATYDPVCLASFINEEAKNTGLSEKDDISLIVIYLRQTKKTNRPNT